jgi:putative transposase
LRLLGLSGVLRAKGVRTTIQAKDGKRAGDLLNRDFTAPAPNRVWVTDFTYVRCWAGWVYVAFILDVFSQRILVLACRDQQRDRTGHGAATNRTVAA